jgi:hypothetical protein
MQPLPLQPDGISRKLTQDARRQEPPQAQAVIGKKSVSGVSMLQLKPRRDLFGR